MYENLDSILAEATSRARRTGALGNLVLVVDPSLPARITGRTDAFVTLVDAVVLWLAGFGAGATVALAIWRDPDAAGLVIEAAARPAADDPDPHASDNAALADAVGALGGSLAVARGEAASRIRIALPGLPDHDGRGDDAAGFAGRRLLVLRDLPLEPETTVRAMARLDATAAVHRSLDDGLAEARAAAAGGRPFDAAVVDAELAGDRLGETLGALRGPAGGAGLRIVVTGLGPEDPVPDEADAVWTRSAAAEPLLALVAGTLAARDDRPARTAQAQVQGVPSFAGVHILVAEDVAMNQTLLEAMLAPTGATCDVAANGVEAVEAMRRRPADLVLMDIQMPEMDGLEATRRIRALAPEVKVIALTANAREADRVTYLASGMDGYLAKPIRVDDLYAALRRALADR